MTQPPGSRFAQRLWLALAGLVLWGNVALATETVIFGVYPHVSAAQLSPRYFLLRDLVARTLGRPVTLVTATDNHSFTERVRQGEYDLILSAPHLARVAERRDGWQRIAQTGYRTEIVVLAKADSELHGLDDLRNHSLAIAPTDSFDYPIMSALLAKQGLSLGQEVKPVIAAGFSNMAYALGRGEADAGVTTRRQWAQATASQHSALREIFHSEPLPGLFVMAHPRLGKPAIQALKQALLSFHDSREGKLYFQRIEHVDFQAIGDDTMRALDPYTGLIDPPASARP
jgi:phosphonate transport system substrate-binding protein